MKSLADFSILTVRAPLLPMSDGFAFGRARVKWGMTPELVSRSEVELCEGECLPFASGGSLECGAYSWIMRSAFEVGCTRTGGDQEGRPPRPSGCSQNGCVGYGTHTRIAFGGAAITTDIDRQIAESCVSSSAFGNPGL